MKLKTVRYTIKDKKISTELSGLRIALFSDLHDHRIGEGDCLLLEALEREEPAAVLLAGDANQKHDSDWKKAGGFTNAAETLRAVAQRWPLYYSMGNHEARWRRNCGGEGLFAIYLEELERAGVHILLNTTEEILPGLTVTGLDLPLEYYHRKHPREVDPKMLRLLAGSPDKDSFNILMAHTPRYFAGYAAWGADLTVSGHLHGGLIRIPGIGGLISPYKTLLPGYDRGLYRENGRSMIVSSGINPHPLRINNPIELVIITLEHKET